MTVKTVKDVEFGLAKVLDLDGTTVHAEATAKWGGLAQATTMAPVAIASCEFSPPPPGGGPTITMYLNNPSPQSGCSSKPGGFDQLEPDVEQRMRGHPPHGEWNRVPRRRDGECAPQGRSVPHPGSPMSRSHLRLGGVHQGRRLQGHWSVPHQGIRHGGPDGLAIPDKWDAANVGQACSDDCLIGNFVQYLLPSDVPNAVLGGGDFGAYQIRLVG